MWTQFLARITKIWPHKRLILDSWIFHPIIMLFRFASLFYEEKKNAFGKMKRTREFLYSSTHNIITSSNFLIYEGKSFDGSAYHKKKWMVFLLFYERRRRRLYRAKTIFSWHQKHITIVSGVSGNLVEKRQSTHIERVRENVFDRNRKIPEKVDLDRVSVCACVLFVCHLYKKLISIDFY